MSSPDDALQTPRSSEVEAAPARLQIASHEQDLHTAREALGGSLPARKRFVEHMRCVPRYLCVLNHRLGRPFSDHELEDLTQETLVEIWRRLDSYAGLASLPTWAFRFCQQVLSSRLRSRRRRPASTELFESEGSPVAPGTSLDFEHVHNAIERLPARDAAIIRLKHFEELTFEQIAERLAMPPSSAKADYHRSIERLRELLDVWHRKGEGWTP
ncbi:MAG: RNA polymerase sigma factor [Planctomycetota bacterium]